MNEAVRWLKSPLGMIVVSLILLSISAIIFAVTQNTKNSIYGYEPSHQDISADTSIVSVKGADIFADSDIETIEGRVLNNIYAKHYQTTGLLERQAKFSRRITKDPDTGVYKFAVDFLPSQTKYQASVEVKNLKEFSYSLKVESAK